MLVKQGKFKNINMKTIDSQQLGKYVEHLQKMNDVSKKLKKPEDGLAKTIAIVVRNQMEDFHCKHLSDAQMKELNPIIRNAIYTTLVQLKEHPVELSMYAKLFIPDYWEDCEIVNL